ncbi:FAD-linked oxidoreductase [Cyathus striatus]|nr:FAD-linked oxidoreductase [Cyathus striatus]
MQLQAPSYIFLLIHHLPIFSSPSHAQGSCLIPHYNNPLSCWPCTFHNARLKKQENLGSRWGVLTAGAFTVLGLSSFYSSPVYADADINDGKRAKQPKASMTSLIRTYVVYTMCSIPPLVDASPKVLEVLSSIPGVRQLTEAFVRVTFFNQFVGADTAKDTLPLLREFRAQNKGCLFAYSVEVDENEANATRSAKTKASEDQPHKKIVDEMINCIDVAADFEDSLGSSMKERRTWVAVKITALVPNAHALINLSSHILKTRPILDPYVPFPGCPDGTDLDAIYKPLDSTSQSPLTKEDIESLRNLHAELERICIRARERGVKIIIDAEYSWYQPALDALTLSLMRRFNKIPIASVNPTDDKIPAVQPLIYATYQAYLRRTPLQLSVAIDDAQKHNYTLGVKLVRGAYHPHELAAHEAVLSVPRKPSLSISPDSEPPVWENKEDTDRSYNSCVKMLLQTVKCDLKSDTTAGLPKIGVLFGTHNWGSCRLILSELVDSGLATEEPNGVVKIRDDVADRVTVGQLYGMSDDLTDYMVGRVSSTAPFIIKYVPYGALSEVMPY